jgi:hypothetical protein
MTNLIKAIKNGFAGNYTVKTTESGGIKPAEFEISYSTSEINQIFEDGANGLASGAGHSSAQSA